ncbi:MAG: hypothetical protein HY999_01790 [Nitrospinae bacterium]|nr:hypothetical protein [Nitrospinota bacterium]
MLEISEGRKRDIEKEEYWQIISQLQGQEAEKGNIPPLRLILRKIRPFLEITGEVLLGILIAEFSLILNFIVFNFLLHMEF